MRFKIRDIDSGLVLFDVSKSEKANNQLKPSTDQDAIRFVRYQFSPDFLNLKMIGATYKDLILFSLFSSTIYFNGLF